jgi:ABC-type phosphate transport system ATPase subunit
MEESLRASFLWDEVKDRLDSPAWRCRAANNNGFAWREA